MGREVYPSRAGAVRFAHARTDRRVLVTEHGLCTPEDSQRAAFIPPALRHLQAVISERVSVHGYVHWSLLDDCEWIFG
jgi:beta-glucosidase